MARIEGMWEKLFVEDMKVGEHFTGKVFFSLRVDGTACGAFEVAIKQSVGAKLFSEEAIEVLGFSPKYRGPFNHRLFRFHLWLFFTSLLGPAGRLVVHDNNKMRTQIINGYLAINPPSTFSFEADDSSCAW